LTNRKRILKKALRILGIIVLVVLGFLLIIGLAIQTPAVQNYISERATRFLSKKIDSEFSIGHIELDLFNRLQLKEVYLEDLDGDTLAYLGMIEARLSLFAPLRKEIEVNGVELNDAYINLRREPDSLYNFQFLIDAFATNSTPDTTTSEPWTFDVNALDLRQVRFCLVDSVARSALYLHAGEFNGRLSQLDLQKQVIDIQDITLANTYFNYTVKSPAPSTVDTSDNSTPLEFPFTGWKITAQSLKLKNVGVGYDDFNQPPQPEGRFDPSHLHFESLDFVADKFTWDSTRLEGNIKQLAFIELNGFQLDQLSAKLLMSETAIKAEEFKIKTPNSDIPSSTIGITYPSFAALPDFVNQGQLEASFDDARLSPNDLTYWIGSLPYLKPEIEQALQFSGALNGAVNDLSLNDFTFRMGNALSGRLTGQIQGLPDLEQLSFDANLRRLRLAYQPIMRLTDSLPLPEGLDTWQWVEVSTRVKGEIDNFTVSPFILKTDKQTNLATRATVTGLPDIEQLTFTASIDSLNTHTQELSAFVEGGLPPQAMELQSINYRGEAQGTLYEYQLDGTLATSRGALDQQMSLQFGKDFKTASYKGSGQLNQFELGRVLGDTATFGPLTMDFQVDGSGLTPAEMNTQFRINATAFEFQGFTYETLKADGKLVENAFNGTASIKGPHLNLSMDGFADLQDTLPEFEMALLVDTIELEPLGFYPTPLSLSTRINVSLRGNQPDDIEGELQLDSFAISNEINTYYTDSIVLQAKETDSANRLLRMNAAFASASLKGDYRINELSDIFIEFVDGFFPVKKYFSPPPPEDDPAVSPQLASQNFELDFQLSEPMPLLVILLPDLAELDTASLTGKFDSDKKLLDLRLFVPYLEYTGIALDSIAFVTDGKPKRLKQSLRVKRIAQDTQELVRDVSSRLSLYQDSLFFDIKVDDRDSTAPKLALNTLMTADQEDYRFSVIPPVMLNHEKWEVPVGNYILFSDSTFQVNKLRLKRGQKAISIQSQDQPTDADFAPVDIEFTSFPLSEIARLVDFDEDFLNGQLNGTARLSRPDTSYLYDIDLKVSDLTLAETKAGDLQLRAQPVSASNAISLDAQLSGEGNDLNLNGEYGLENSALDFQLDAAAIRLGIFDFFALGAIRDSKGYAGADIAISGTVKEPAVSGSLSLDSASTVIDYLQTRYLIPNHRIEISKNQVSFGEMNLIDPNGEKAVFAGNIQHQNFEDITLDLRFEAPSFQVLNTSQKDNDLFYGKILVDIRAEIDGPLNTPNVNVNARTLEGTKLTALPLSQEEAVLGSEDYILYGTPASYRADTSQRASNLYQSPNTGVNLLLNLTLTPQAKIIALIDPSTGDKLQASGSANLIVEMDRAGNLSTTGEIRVTDGSYFLNYQGLVKRQFDIQSGSTINLPGNPLDARFDITAVYDTRVSPYELIKGQAQLEGSAASAAKRRQEFSVFMQLEGTLSEPEISFDIRPGDQQASAISNTIEQKLAQIRQNQSELNKQVFGLLLFNSFIIESGAPVDLASAGENLALNSVSSFLSNQLNRLADRYVKGFELDIGLESYKSNFSDESTTTTTELDVGVSKALFNDRLVVQVGSSLGIDETNSGEQANANITGSFLLEYKLDEDGTYRLRVFRRPDYDIFNDANAVRTGAGIIYKKSFGSPRPSKPDSLKND